ISVLFLTPLGRDLFIERNAKKRTRPFCFSAARCRGHVRQTAHLPNERPTTGLSIRRRRKTKKWGMWHAILSTDHALPGLRPTRRLPGSKDMHTPQQNGCVCLSSKLRLGDLLIELKVTKRTKPNQTHSI